MTSYARCLLFLLFVISFFLQIHAREIKFFSKVTKETKINNAAYISLSPALSPALSPEPQVVEHGYGLYGRDPYENTPTKTVMSTKKTISGEDEKYVPAQELIQDKDDNYSTQYPVTPSQDLPHYPPTTETPAKNTLLGDEKYVHIGESSNKNGNEYQFSPTTKNPVFGEEKYVSERQGMSDTRFLENGKYYYDVNQDSKDVSSFVAYEDNGYVSNKQGMSDTRFMENGKYFYHVQNEDGVKDNNNQDHSNVDNNNNDRFQDKKNGMSDNRYLNNGKYFYDVNRDNVNDNNNENEQFQEEKPGMSNTRYLDNGKYFYAVNDENVNNRKYETQGRGGYNYYERNTNFPNEYVAQGRKGNYGGTKKFPNEYDTMEEYDREQGYIDPRDVYVP